MIKSIISFNITLNVAGGIVRALVYFFAAEADAFSGVSHDN